MSSNLSELQWEDAQLTSYGVACRGHNDDTLGRVDNNCDKVDTSCDDHKLVGRMDQVQEDQAYHHNQSVMTELIRVVRVAVVVPDDPHHQQMVAYVEQELVEHHRDRRRVDGTYRPVDLSYLCSYYY